MKATTKRTVRTGKGTRVCWFSPVPTGDSILHRGPNVSEFNWLDMMES